MTDSDSNSDGFVSIGKMSTEKAMATFRTATATIPVPETCSNPERVDVQWDGKGLLRFRWGATGQYKVYHTSRRFAQIPTTVLYRAIGRVLDARFPVLRSAGCDLYIDIRQESEETPQ